MAAAFYIFRVKDASGAFVKRPWGAWSESRIAIDRAAECVSLELHGPGSGHVVRESTPEVAREQFGATDPKDNTVREALDAAFDFDEMFGTGWYLEIRDPDGKLSYAERGRTFDQVLSALRAKRGNQVAEFIAPSSATPNEISALENLGVRPA